MLMMALGFLLGLTVTCMAEDANDVYSSLEQFFSQVQNKQVITAEFSDVQIKEADPNRLLRFLEVYATSTDVGVRWQAHGLEAKVAKLHAVGQIRHQVVERLVNALVSKDEVDRNLHAAYSELLLDNFQGADFNGDAKGAILRALEADNPRKELIRVSGVAQLREALPRLAEVLIDEAEFETKWQRIGRKWYYTRGWNARLARARMGVTEDIERCIKLVDDEIEQGGYFEGRVGTPVTHLLRDIAYIRQPPAIEYLQQQLGSSRKLWGSHGDPSEPVASYVLDLLADCLKDFPIEKRPGRWYNSEEIEQAQNWMRQQKPSNIIR
jgi:hypothetical protein